MAVEDVAGYVGLLDSTEREIPTSPARANGANVSFLSEERERWMSTTIRWWKNM